jgi:molecular chaperone DnaK
LGAAIQAGVLGGEVKDVLLLDVTPLTLSIETLGGVATPLIERNTTIPTKKSQIFSTAADSQTQVEIHVTQGERPMSADNKSLGRFILDGIPPAPRGVPQIEVTFDINADGILNVSAKDKATGREQAMQIVPSSGLSDNEIDRMVQQAEKHASEDQKRKEAVEARNMADTAVYSAEKFISENGEQLPDAQKASLQSQIEAVKSALDSDDPDAIKSAVQQLQMTMQQAGAAMYEGQPGAGPGGPGAPGGPGTPPPPPGEGDGGDGGDDEDVIEGEFSDA